MRKTVSVLAICLAFALAAATWVQAGAPIPPVGSATDTIYNVLDPRGIAAPVNFVGLAPRLTTLVGKKILVDQGEADPVIMPALWARLTAEHPEITWFHEVSSSFGPTSVESTADDAGAPFWTKATGPLIDAIIRGNAW